MSASVPFLFLLWLFGQRKREHPAPVPTRSPRPPLPGPSVLTSSPTTPPWPGSPRPASSPASSHPAGVPPYPGPEWITDLPPTPGVPQRASQLLPMLWRTGEGSYRIERTGGRWIAYRATRMGAKRGVTAKRLREQPLTVPDAATVRVPVRAVVQPRPRPAPAPAPAPAATSLPTLRRGSSGPAVVTLQTKLGGLDVDGKFGPQTDAAVRAFQGAKGLTIDGIVGKQTWGALFA